MKQSFQAIGLLRDDESKLKFVHAEASNSFESTSAFDGKKLDELSLHVTGINDAADCDRIIAFLKIVRTCFTGPRMGCIVLFISFSLASMSQPFRAQSKEPAHRYYTEGVDMLTAFFFLIAAAAIVLGIIYFKRHRTEDDASYRENILMKQAALKFNSHPEALDAPLPSLHDGDDPVN